MLLRQLGHKVITFKSVAPYFHKEMLGRKRNTIRVIDYGDIRFRELATMEVLNHYGYIRIIEVTNNKRQLSFKKKIKDISFWKGLVIISW